MTTARRWLRRPDTDGVFSQRTVTWLICAGIWRRWSAKAGAYCTLFQGCVALPLALGLTALTPGPERPTMVGLVYLVGSGQFTQVPKAMVILLVTRWTALQIVGP